MTDNEAIEIVDNAIKSRFLTGLHVGHEFAEALGLVVGLAIRASTNDKLYNPTGDLISREALKDIAYINKGNFNTVEGIREWIDNAQAIHLPNNQIAWEQGYEAGLAQGKVEITEEQAINKLHETGWLIGHDKEMTTRPQGEWINREAISNTIFPFWERYECNQCHKFNGYSNFCPNCGADMRKGGKEE